MSASGRLRLSRTEQRVVWAGGAALLAYPDEPMLDQLDLVGAAVAGLPASVATPLTRVLDYLHRTDPQVLAEHYVRVLDQKRACAPYLTYYVHGDTRRRGMALVEVVETYRAAGFQPVPDELPDHLAVVLEFAATVDPDAGRALLIAHRPGLQLMARSLTRVSSPYADVVTAVLRTLPELATAERATAERLASAGPPVELVGLDPYPHSSTTR